MVTVDRQRFVTGSDAVGPVIGVMLLTPPSAWTRRNSSVERRGRHALDRLFDSYGPVRDGNNAATHARVSQHRPWAGAHAYAVRYRPGRGRVPVSSADTRPVAGRPAHAGVWSPPQSRRSDPPAPRPAKRSTCWTAVTKTDRHRFPVVRTPAERRMPANWTAIAPGRCLDYRRIISHQGLYIRI